MTRTLDKLEVSYRLDGRWHQLRGEVTRSKKGDLERLIEVLESEGVSYAVIGGIAVQIHSASPRTTLDVDIAVIARERIPAQALQKVGFSRTGSFAHSENWVGPEATPVQFTDDPALQPAVEAATRHDAGSFGFFVIGREDLVHAKLRAAADGARRRSKRLMDLADVQNLLEETPGLAESLSEQERQLLTRLVPPDQP